MPAPIADRATGSPPEATGLPARRGASSMPLDLQAAVRGILVRHPAVGLAVGVVRDGRLAAFHAEGVADVSTRTPIAADTVFRVGSVTKLFTAIAVMQLVEAGRLDLDAPADAALRAYRLVPDQSRWRPPTVRHLLTHTAGIPEIRGLGDLLRADFTPAGGRPATVSVPFGDPLPSLAEVYRAGLRVVVEPGTSFAYSNHGFATLGQIVEDVSGVPLPEYVRRHLVEPLGLSETGLARTARLASHLATGYRMTGTGPRRVADREWTDRAAGQLYSSGRDLGWFLAALLGGGANRHGRVLAPATLETIFAPQFQPDPRIPGIGLACFRGDVAGHRTVAHDGILPGFNASVLLAPDDGVGLFALTNGSAGAFGWLQVELDRLLRELLGATAASTRTAVPPRPETWPELCGRYVLEPRIGDLRGRLVLNGGAEVGVLGGRLAVRLRTPVPIPVGGIPLDGLDGRDPDVFSMDLTSFGMPPARVVFGRDRDGRVTAVHADLGGQPWTLLRRADGATRRTWAVAGLAAITAVVAGSARRRRVRTPAGTP